MFGCSTSCPKCKHEFQCCPVGSPCTGGASQRFSGGGLVDALNLDQEEAAPPPPPPPPCSIVKPCQSPQVSPSMPLAFVMPQPTLPLVLAPTPYDLTRPENDLERLTDTVKVLRLSGWYHEHITYPVSHELLKNTKVGTFLVRNSSDPRFLFSLSIQTEKGPTSVRLCYQHGLFRLDAQSHLLAAMPMFPCVGALVEHYVNQSKLCRNGSQVWVDLSGKCYSPIMLERPLRKKCSPPSLMHLSRLAINKELKLWTRPKVLFMTPQAQLELPASLTAYLQQYPYSL